MRFKQSDAFQRWRRGSSVQDILEKHLGLPGNSNVVVRGEEKMHGANET